MPILDSLAKPEDAAAVWSAIAATFSAIAAYASWRAQIKTLRHSFRPELSIGGWTRVVGSEDSTDELRFSQFRNTGRDTAFHVFAHASGTDAQDRPTYIAGTVSVPSLVPGESAQVDGRILIFWPNVTKSQVGKMLGIKLIAWYWDNLGTRHEAKVTLFVRQDSGAPLGNMLPVAPGVYLQSYTSSATPVWVLKLRRAVSNIPLLGRLLERQ